MDKEMKTSLRCLHTLMHCVLRKHVESFYTTVRVRTVITTRFEGRLVPVACCSACVPLRVCSLQN